MKGKIVRFPSYNIEENALLKVGNILKNYGTNVLIVVAGGGKAIDRGKGVAEKAGIPSFTIPTIAAI